jgi:dihydroxyacetone kinase
LTTQESVNALSLAEAFVIAVNAVAELGGAKLNDRTMYDALYPAASTFKQALLAGETPARAWHLAVNAAENGAQLTAQMLPKLGRASYLGERALGIPDAGAAAVVVWLKAILI